MFVYTLKSLIDIKSISNNRAKKKHGNQKDKVYVCSEALCVERHLFISLAQQKDRVKTLVSIRHKSGASISPNLCLRLTF